MCVAEGVGLRPGGLQSVGPSEAGEQAYLGMEN